MKGSGAAVAFAACSIAIFGAPQGLAAQRFRVAPPPSWVLAGEVDTSRAPAEGASDGVEYLFVDRQTRVAGDDVQVYRRTAQRLVTTSGLDETSHVELEWDPSYEELVIHSIAVLRKGVVLDRLDPARIEVLRRETGLEERMYHGTLSAVLVVDDLRVGDVLDVAYTLRGANPVFDAVFSTAYSTGWSVPVASARWRLLWPAKRALEVRAFGAPAPERSAQGDFVEYSWVGRDIAAIADEDAEPIAFDAYPRVRLSEDRTWAEVARWGRGLYGTARRLSGPLAARVEEWRKTSSTDEEKIAAVLHFAQAEIRYVGIELGEGSHRPSAPDVVFERRFGDCKDKANFMVAALGALGIEAWPAFVNTRARETIQSWPPSRAAFDHVIVAVAHGDRLLWLDPTMGPQGDPPTKIIPPKYGRALVVRDDTTGLTEIPAPVLDTPAISVQERWRLGTGERAGSVEVISTYRGHEADRQRSELETTPREEIGKAYLNYYAALHPSIRAEGPFAVKDDVANNELVITERYSVPELWQPGALRREEAALTATVVRDLVTRPNVRQRAHPLALRNPVHVEHHIDAELPAGFVLEEENETVDRPELLVTRSVALKDRQTLSLRWVWRSRADVVPVTDVAAHLEALDRISALATYSISRSMKDAPDDDLNWPVAAVGFIALVLSLAVAIQIYRHHTPPLPAWVDDPSLVGIKGWLILLAINLTLSPVVIVLAFISQLNAYTTSQWLYLTAPTSAGYQPGLAPLLLVELVWKVASAVLSSLVALLLWKKRSDFPRWAMVFLGATALFVFGDTAVSAQYVDTDAQDWQAAVQALVFSGVWMTYLAQSKRVKATFTK